jgi:hypothetical protein
VNGLAQEWIAALMEAGLVISGPPDDAGEEIVDA